MGVFYGNRTTPSLSSGPRALTGRLQEVPLAAVAIPKGPPAQTAASRRQGGRHAGPGARQAGHDGPVARALEGRHAHRGRDAAQGQVHHLRPQGEEVPEEHPQCVSAVSCIALPLPGPRLTFCRAAKVDQSLAKTQPAGLLSLEPPDLPSRTVCLLCALERRRERPDTHQTSGKGSRRTVLPRFGREGRLPTGRHILHITGTGEGDMVVMCRESLRAPKTPNTHACSCQHIRTYCHVGLDATHTRQLWCVRASVEAAVRPRYRRRRYSVFMTTSPVQAR